MAPTWLDLYEWRRRVADIYRERERALIGGEDPALVLDRFRAQKDELFARHPQSPINEKHRAEFAGLNYFPYNPALRLEGLLQPDMSEGAEEVGTSAAHTMPMRRAASLHFSMDGVPLQLTVYWIDVYGGGLFVPFHDATCPGESYGGGRYLFDTVKGSDFLRLDPDKEMGYAGGRVVVDFNYAYNPSCAYDPLWVCPLAPRENYLVPTIRAGERNFHD